MDWSAATSHEKNDEYMQRFHAAFRRLQNLSIEETTNNEVDHLTAASRDQIRSPVLSSSEQSTTTRETTYAARSCAWREGIDVEAGITLDLSQRPLLTSALNTETNQIAIGGSDHAVYTVDCSTKRLSRTLYTRTSGHSEWVTCVTYTPDGRVVSGAMDQKLCLWGINSSRCLDLIGHRGSISGVTCLHNYIISSSYDKSVKLWNCTSGRLRGTLVGHKAPILRLEPNRDKQVATGDRGGSTFIWNLEDECLSWRLKKIHKGHITSICWLLEASSHGLNSSSGGSHFLTGGQDGVLRLWDMRNRSNVFKEKVHGGLQTSAAINEILVHRINSNLLITCGADQTLKVLDLRNACLESVWEVALADFPYSVELCGDLVFCGCGDGSISIFDIGLLTVKATIQPSTSAIRFIHSFNNQLICGGDEGKLFVFDIN